MSLECGICFEKCSFMKYLSCHHSFCANCLQQLAKKSPEDGESIECPLDRKKTNLQNGVNGLKTYFLVICESCFEENPVSKCWWCSNCEKSLCTTCIIKQHRDHKFSEWEEYEVVKICANVLQSYASENVGEKIHQFCMELEKSLQEKFAWDTECRKLLSSMKCVFDVTPSTQSANNLTCKNLEKHLSTIAKIMDYSEHSAKNQTMSNDVIKKLPGSLRDNMNLTDVKEVVAWISDKMTMKNVHSSQSIATSNCSIAWSTLKTAHWKTPSFICPTETGVIVIDNDQQLVYYDSDTDRFHSPGKSVIPVKIGKPCSALYLRKSVFVTHQPEPGSSKRYLIEYTLPTLNFAYYYKFPNNASTFDQCAVRWYTYVLQKC